jgi:hypothetical protein
MQAETRNTAPGGSAACAGASKAFKEARKIIAARCSRLALAGLQGSAAPLKGVGGADRLTPF